MLSVPSISLPLLSDPTLSTGEVRSHHERMRPWRLKTIFLAWLQIWSYHPTSRIVCNQDVGFVICVSPQDMTSILLLAGHHLYSRPEKSLVAKIRSLGLCCCWISLMSPFKLSIRRATSHIDDVVGSVRICFTRIQMELFHSNSLDSESGVHRALTLLSDNH